MKDSFFLRLLVPLFVAFPTVVGAQDLQINPIAGLSADFIRGADISTLLAVEKAGGNFRDVDGKPGDLLVLLKSHGINWVRLRLWNDPTLAGVPVGGGNNDLATTIELSRRAKALGLKVLLDFHYSDFWADPAHQETPKAWKDLDLPALDKAVYDFTKRVLAALAEAKALPDMVQLGNEINGGMLWPTGKTWKSTPEEKVGGLDGLAQLLSAGAKAVRELDPSAKIAVHLADGGDHELYQRVFDELTKRNLDFDIVGFSYYPFWHGPLEQLADNLKVVSARYHKDVAVLETAYARTIEDADGFSNAFGPGLDLTGGYRATPQGQATAVRDVMAAVAAVPDNRGLGVFYWEPAWLPIKGVGWKSGEGNNWDNMTLFSSSGWAVPSLDVFRRVGLQGTSVAPVPVEVLPVTLGWALDAKDWPVPDRVQTLFSDDAYRWVPVTWDPVVRSAVTAPGPITLRGTLTGTKLSFNANVTIVPFSNLLQDPGFESGTFGGWKIEGDADAVKVENNPGNARTGNYTLKYWKDKAFRFTARQKVGGLADGVYSLRVWSMGGGGENSMTLSVRSGASEEVLRKIVNTGWKKWKDYTIEAVKVTDGTLEIALTVDGKNGCWGNFDDLELLKTGR